MTLAGCRDLYNSPEAPAYIEIDSVRFNTSGSQGKAIHDIRDIWVFANGRFVGTFELPCRFPVASKGKTALSIQPGVYSDGRRSFRIIYPYYTEYLDTIDMVPGQAYKLTPRYTYETGLGQPWRFAEEFNSASNLQFEKGTSGNIPVVVSQNPTYAPPDGSSYGLMLAPPLQKQGGGDSAQVMEMSTKAQLTLPQDGRTRVFVEFRYRNSLAMAVGIIGTQTGGTVRDRVFDLVLLPTDTWKFVYVDITQLLNASILQKPTNVNLYVQSVGDGKSTQHIAIDDFRVVTLNP